MQTDKQGGRQELEINPVTHSPPFLAPPSTFSSTREIEECSQSMAVAMATEESHEPASIMWRHGGEW